SERDLVASIEDSSRNDAFHRLTQADLLLAGPDLEPIRQTEAYLDDAVVEVGHARLDAERHAVAVLESEQARQRLRTDLPPQVLRKHGPLARVDHHWRRI